MTAAGAVLSTGTITNSGTMTGTPLRFYLTGKEIDSIRFSCKNEQLLFTDWTETRENLGLSHNFTVSYGQNTKDYRSLLLIHILCSDSIQPLRSILKI